MKSTIIFTRFCNGVQFTGSMMCEIKEVEDTSIWLLEIINNDLFGGLIYIGFYIFAGKWII